MYYINILLQVLGSDETNDYHLLVVRSVCNRHRYQVAAKFNVFADEDHDKLHTLFLLPKRHNRPYKSWCIANSSSCSTSKLYIILSSCKRFMRGVIHVSF